MGSLPPPAESGSLPPLVEPGPPLAPDEATRYSRHLLLPDIGSLGQRRLRNARVLVIGAGGLGSPVLLYLAAAGVGTIGVIDLDEVDSTNLQRQVVHGESDVGRPKVDSARDAVARINSGVTVETHRDRLDADNAVELFSRYDLILDGTDNFATRYLVNDAAELAGKPYVWGSLYRFSGQVSVFWAAAPDGRARTYRDLYPQAPPPGTVPSCAEGGVLGVLCGTIGSLMATEALKLITGVGESLLGRVLIYDAAAMSIRTLTLPADPQRAPVTRLIDYEAFCGLSPADRDDADGLGSSDGPGPGSDGRDFAIDAAELERRRHSAHPPVLIDVREPVEREIVSIPDAIGIPVGRLLAGPGLDEVPGDVPLVLYCKTGIRSARALEAVRAAGFTDAVHLAGGIVAWSAHVQPAAATY